MSAEPGQLITLLVPSRPRSWWIFAIFGIGFTAMALLGSNVTAGITAGWLAFASLLTYSRTPPAIAVHAGGLVLGVGRRERFYPWSEVLEISEDEYGDRSAALGATSYSLRLKGRTVVLGPDDGLALSRLIQKHRAPEAITPTVW